MFGRTITSTFTALALHTVRKSVPLPLAMMLLYGGILSSGAAAAQGADSPVLTTPSSSPAKDCATGVTNVDRATCIKESAAAKGEAKRGQLASPDGAYEANALQRCQTLPESDKQQCELRIRGAGTTEGTIGGGGQIHEVRTRTSDAVPVETVSPAPAGKTGQ